MGLWQGAAQPGRVRLDAIIEAGLGPSLCHTLRIKISPCPHPNDVGGGVNTPALMCVSVCVHWMVWGQSISGLPGHWAELPGTLGSLFRSPG